MVCTRADARSQTRCPAAQREWNAMSLKCGIVGLPNVGKSTLFNALTKAGIAAENYPFCTIEPNVGIVEVPDPRLAALAAIAKPREGRSRRSSSSSTSPASSPARRRARASATSSSRTSARPTRSRTSCAASRTRTSSTSPARSIRSPTSRRSTPSWRSPTSRRSRSSIAKVREARARRRRQGSAAHWSRVLEKVRAALNEAQAGAHRRSLRRRACAAEAATSCSR